MKGIAMLACITLCACRSPKGRESKGPPVTIRFEHELSADRVKMDLKSRPRVTFRYVAVGDEYDRGHDAGVVTFTYDPKVDGGVPPTQTHEASLAPGLYRIEACLDKVGATDKEVLGCTNRPADYLAAAEVSGKTAFTVRADTKRIVVHWGNLNPAWPDAAKDAAAVH